MCTPYDRNGNCVERLLFRLIRFLALAFFLPEIIRRNMYCHVVKLEVIFLKDTIIRNKECFSSF